MTKRSHVCRFRQRERERQEERQRATTGVVAAMSEDPFASTELLLSGDI